jgi:hypothetical protein
MMTLPCPRLRRASTCSDGSGHSRSSTSIVSTALGTGRPQNQEYWPTPARSTVADSQSPSATAEVSAPL